MAKMSRRKFVGMTSAAVAATYLPWRFGARPARAFYNSNATPLWQTQFRGVGPGAIPVAAPDAGGAPVTGVRHYTIDIGQYTDQIHPGLGPTKLWGYNPVSPLGGGTQPQRHLGGIIVAQKDVPIQITFNNLLPPDPIIPVDLSIAGANQAFNRAAVHLHGGAVPWISDGGPHDWFTPATNPNPTTPGVGVGFSFLNNTVLNPAALPGQAEYYYPMNQSARFMWYHDHAWGITRTNAYAGIASGLLIRDAFEINLKNQGLPEFIENSVLGGTPVRELPIVVQDKVFVGTDGASGDPGWTGPTAPGSLWYAHTYDTALYGKLGPAPLGAPTGVSCVPEFFGDTMLANGTVFPEATVEGGRYRLRLLNACNARFLNLQMYVDDGSPNGITLNNAGAPLNIPAVNPSAPNSKGKGTNNWLVLGTEGGFLPAPVWVPSNVPFNGTPQAGSLLLAPAERADVLFDFSAYVGKKIVLYTDCPAPFPGGAPTNDYFPGWNPNKNPVNALTQPGFGPNTRVIMRFNVVAPTITDQPLTIAKGMSLTAGNDPLFVPAGVTTPPPSTTKTRPLTLNEGFDGYGRLIQMLGTNVQLTPGTFGREYGADPTETPAIDAIEVWQITNLTADTHPIHFHLCNVQILSRQPFTGNYNGIPNLSGAPLPPQPFEAGWKETVRMNPGEVTTVVMQFKLPPNPPNVASIPTSPRTGGYEYVWHCHILEHEEHDMMRPLVVG